jgi:tetratricopeptide (TPR) repeat protein
MIGEGGQSILLKVRRRRVCGALALAALLLGAGCGGDNSSLSIEKDDPLYREGLQLTREGRTPEALAAYLKLIAKRGDQAPESHLDAGLICLENIKDPIAAIYHFKKYLAFEPNSPNAVYVRGLVDAATREFARTLPGRPMDSQTGGGELLEQVASLQRENDQLKAELLEVRSRDASAAGVTAAAAPVAVGEPAGSTALTPAAAEADSAPVVLTPVAPAETAAPPPPPPVIPERAAPAAKASPSSSARNYTVQAHDTLYGIAKKVYGSATNAKVQAILQANRRVLPSANALKPGMELRIP